MRTRKRKFRSNKRRGIAAVEAAVCLPVVIVIWLGTVEVSTVLTLKQQSQLIAAAAAQQTLESTATFTEIETKFKNLADSIGIEGATVSLRQFDGEIVETEVTIDVGPNSTFGSLLKTKNVNSKYYSYREDKDFEPQAQ